MAKKKQPTGKMNRVCYIDAELDARMKKASEVNWSAVASAAFERELLLMKGRTTMGNAIERMRQADEEDRSEAFEDGTAAGKAWATDDARPKHLRALDAWRARLGYDYNRIDVMFPHVMEAMGIDIDDYDLRDVATVETVFGATLADIESEDWVRGFVNGALDAWADIEPQL